MKKKIKGTMRVSDLLSALAKKAPFELAETWDNVGLLIGSPKAEVAGVVIAVNLGLESIEAAKKAKANVIVCHHPPIFKPISKFTDANQKWAFEAVKLGIAVIALHTNFDLSSEELNQDLAKLFSAKYKSHLSTNANRKASNTTRLGKFVTYIPKTHTKDMREALSSAGAGEIGNYSECSFMIEGIGTFKGEASTHPAVGKAGKLEHAEEVRLEMVFPIRHMEKVVAAARKVHPYEEMAFDILTLENPIRDIGYGFIADFPQKMAFPKLLKSVKQIFQLNAVMAVSGPVLDQPNLEIQRIAFSPGSGSAFISDAIAKRVDVYICGEMGYHQVLEARTAGVSVLTIGHSNSELFFVKTVARWMRDGFPSVVEVFERIHDVK